MQFLAMNPFINNSSKTLQIQASNKLKNEYKLVKRDMKIIAIKELMDIVLQINQGD